MWLFSRLAFGARDTSGWRRWIIRLAGTATFVGTGAALGWLFVRYPGSHEIAVGDDHLAPIPDWPLRWGLCVALVSLLLCAVASLSAPRCGPGVAVDAGADRRVAWAMTLGLDTGLVIAAIAGWDTERASVPIVMAVIVSVIPPWMHRGREKWLTEQVSNGERPKTR